MNRNLKKEFSGAVVPAFVGAIGMALYYFTDGLFIGNAVGDDGMSAITVSWNIVTFITAIATGIGMGGSIRFSVAAGERNRRDERSYFLSTVLLLLASSAILTVFMLFFEQQVLTMLGADGRVLELSTQYTDLVVYGIVFQIVGLGALPLVRNLGGHKVASISMGAGYIINFVLDYVLMIHYPLGMFGCAVAYITGQIVVAVPCVVFLIKEYKRRYSKSIDTPSIGLLKSFSGVLVTGIAPSGLYFAQAVVSACVNSGFLRHGGSEALACYTTVIYIAGISNTLHRAVMEGSQPLLSLYHGRGDTVASRYTSTRMYLVSLITVGVGGLVAMLFRNEIAGMFGLSEAVTIEVTRHLPLYLIAYLCISFSRTTVSYLSAVDCRLLAGLLTYAEPALMITAAALLPLAFGVSGMWIAVLSVYGLMALIAAAFLILKNRRESSVQGA